MSRYTDEHIISEPAAHKYKLLALEGSKRSPLVFNFHYRSHSKDHVSNRVHFKALTAIDALQIIGCIPRAPSPPIEIEEAHEPEIKPVLAPDNRERIQAVLSQRAEERQRLLASLR